MRRAERWLDLTRDIAGLERIAKLGKITDAQRRDVEALRKERDAVRAEFTMHDRRELDDLLADERAMLGRRPPQPT